MDARACAMWHDRAAVGRMLPGEIGRGEVQAQCGRWDRAWRWWLPGLLASRHLRGGGRLAPGSPWGSRPGEGRRWVLWSTSLTAKPPARPWLSAAHVLCAASGSCRRPPPAAGGRQQRPAILVVGASRRRPARAGGSRRQPSRTGVSVRRQHSGPCFQYTSQGSSRIQDLPPLDMFPVACSDISVDGGVGQRLHLQLVPRLLLACIGQPLPRRAILDSAQCNAQHNAPHKVRHSVHPSVGT